MPPDDEVKVILGMFKSLFLLLSLLVGALQLFKFIDFVSDELAQVGLGGMGRTVGKQSF